MDVEMSVASTLNELHFRNPSMSRSELFASGMNVGKDMTGTMSNTLILAFAGGSLGTLMLNYAYDLPYAQVVNSYQIGIKIMQGVSGSIGIILTVPLVSLISSLMLGARRASAAAMQQTEGFLPQKRCRLPAASAPRSSRAGQNRDSHRQYCHNDRRRLHDLAARRDGGDIGRTPKAPSVQRSTAPYIA